MVQTLRGARKEVCGDVDWNVGVRGGGGDGCGFWSGMSGDGVHSNGGKVNVFRLNEVGVTVKNAIADGV